MRPPERRSLDALLTDLGRWGERASACALGARLGTEPEATGRLLAVGAPLVLVALVRRAATSHGTDLLLTTLDRTSRSAVAGAGGAPSEAAAEAEVLLGRLLGARRGALEAQLQRLAGAPPTSVRRVLEAVALRVLACLAEAPADEGLDARSLCRGLGVALSRAEDAVPGAVGAFEELLDGGAPAEEDALVRIGRLLLESLGRSPGQDE